MAVTSSNPNAGWSWTRYVDSGQGFRRFSESSGWSVRPLVDTAQHHQRPGADVDLLALLHRLTFTETGLPGDGGGTAGAADRVPAQRQVVGVEDHDPVIAPVPVRDREGQLFVVGVEE